MTITVFVGISVGDIKREYSYYTSSNKYEVIEQVGRNTHVLQEDEAEIPDYVKEAIKILWEGEQEV